MDRDGSGIPIAYSNTTQLEPAQCHAVCGAFEVWQCSCRVYLKVCTAVVRDEKTML